MEILVWMIMRKEILIKMIIDSKHPIFIKEPLILVISGPTASGKSQLAIELSKKLDSDIISFDSRQFYKEIPIGTASPDSYQLSQASHHFIGHKSIHDFYNAELFSLEARIKITELAKKNKPIILVGGSGLYLDALLYGFDPIPEIDRTIRNRLNKIFHEEGINPLQALLKEKDPEYFSKVDLKNPQRLIRALEVCFSTGNPYSFFRKGQKKKKDNRVLKFCLSQPIPLLYERINQRVIKMIEQGLVEEVRSMADFQDLNPLKTVGYTELFKYLKGNFSLEEAIDKIKQHTRNFAKRQLTWFRRDYDYQWVEGEDTSLIATQILKNISF